MSGMDDLVAWLRAQLDEDERVVRGSGALGWLTYRHEDGSMAYTIPAALAEDGTWIAVGAMTGYASAVVVHREAERLAEVKAKRALLDLHPPFIDHAGRVRCVNCMALCHSSSGLRCDEPADAMHPCEGLTDIARLLARPYAGRPGWREEWGIGG